MATGPYGLPQGIDIDGQRHQAVPRKVGAYDTEAYNDGTVIGNGGNAASPRSVAHRTRVGLDRSGTRTIA